MKDYLKKILIITLSLLVLCSCGSKVTPPVEPTKPENNFNTQTSKEENDGMPTLHFYKEPELDMNYEEVKTEYPDKKMLIWAVPATTEKLPTRAVNEYLGSLGKDYVVYFEPVVGGNADINSLIEHISAGNQVDIIDSNAFSVGNGAVYTSSYFAFVYNNIFADISERLTETECGRALYDLMPEVYWDSLRVEGKLYGVDGYMSCVTPPRYVIYDKAIVEKYGFDTSKPVFSQSDEILDIVKKEDCNGVIMLEYDLYYFQHVSSGVSWNLAYFDETEGCIKSLLDNEAYCEILKTVYKMTKNGSSVYCADAKNDKPEFAQITTNIGSCESGKYHGGDGELHDAVIVESLPATISNTKSAVGVCNSSVYPEEAFELLCLSQTDKYLCELLSYGVEENRVYTDSGAIDMTDKYYYWYHFTNHMICTPFYTSHTEFVVSKDSMLNAIENGKVDPLLGFNLDASKIVSEFQECYKIVFDDYYGYGMVSHITESESFEDFIETFRAKLKKAGIDEVIEESNIQYERWRKK